MNIYVQYIFIAIVLVFAVGYVVKLFKNTFFNKKKGCGSTNCKCGK